ncbi:MAG: DUF4197 family protein [Bacteroidetes bacterium]|nr:DUF4197 family protein [Bacteroidota bacterium]
MTSFQKILFICFFSLGLTACTTQQIQETIGIVLGSGEPTEGETANGLKEALVTGIIKGTGLLSQTDGFGNNLVKIPWPEEAQFVATALQKLVLADWWIKLLFH